MPTAASLWGVGATGLILAFSGPAPAAQYLAWSAGDSATYREAATGAEIRVEAAQADRLWLRFTEFAGLGVLSVFSTGRDDRVYVSGEGRNIQLLSDFGAAAGSYTPLDLPPCNRGGAILAARDRLTVPGGAFENVVRIDFQTSCADAGVISAWFARGVGPIQWTAATIAGPSTFQMTSANVGGIAYPRNPGVTLVAEFPEPTVWIDMMPVTPKPVKAVDVGLTIRNSSAEEITYSFASGQHFEIEVIDAAGQVVARWSRDKAFTQALNHLTIPPGESRRFGGLIRLCYDDGSALAPGQYTFRIYLSNITPLGVAPPQGAAPIEVRWAF